MIGYATLVAGHEDAEDIVQSVFVRALSARRRDLARIEDGAAYLLGATRNEALNTLRARGRRAVREQGAAERSALQAPGTPGALGALGPTDEPMAEALHGLPEDQREAIWLRHGAGLSFDQLALALGVPRSTAASRYRAGVDRLREALREKEPSHV
jgi:RNA polymerase sigma-70 factor (ECF subfamily)